MIFIQNFVQLANNMIGIQKLVKTVPRISTPTKPFPSTVSSVPPDTSHMERDLIPVSGCQYQVQTQLPHYAEFYIYHMNLVMLKKFKYLFYIYYNYIFLSNVGNNSPLIILFFFTQKLYSSNIGIFIPNSNVIKKHELNFVYFTKNWELCMSFTSQCTRATHLFLRRHIANFYCIFIKIEVGNAVAYPPPFAH